MRIAFCVFDYKFNRFDKFIAKTLNLGRRKVNYLFLENRIYKNRKKAKKADNVNIRDLIEIEIEEENFDYREIEVVFESKDYFIIYKPARYHSQEIFKNKKSVENFLRKNFGDNVKLLNRLDFYSQGFLIASKNKEFYERYKELEENKKIEKFYLTFVSGKILKNITIKNNIDYKKRKIVKVLNEESDIINTEIYPLGVYNNFSILIAKIFKGARHQIRAHLAYINHPLIGDFIYGEKVSNLDFFLFCFGYKCKELNLNFFDYTYLKRDASNYLKALIQAKI